MSPAEVVYWREYMREPHGEQRQDYLAAQITQAVYTFMAGFSKDSTKVKFEDCLLKFDDSSYTQEAADKRTLQALAAVSALFGKSAGDFVSRAKAKIEATKAARALTVDTPPKR